jgi:hypothetical protein
MNYLPKAVIIYVLIAIAGHAACIGEERRGVHTEYW